MAAQVVGASITAVASRTAAKSAERAVQFNTVSVSYEQLPAGADIVIVATPPAHHFSHTVHALENGSAVIVEKPLVFTLDEADRLLHLVEHSGAKVLYAENLAYAPVVHAFIKRVATIGPLNHLVLKTIQSLPQWGDFTTAQWGGGALFDLGVHPLALAVLIGRATGAGEVVALGEGVTEFKPGDKICALANGGDLSKIPFFAAISICLCAAILGMARGALEEYLGSMKGRTSRGAAAGFSRPTRPARP